MKKLITYITAAICLMSNSVMAQETPTFSVIKQDIEFCSINPTSVFCDKTLSIPIAVEGGQDPYLKILKDSDSHTKKRFSGRKETIDVWNSYGREFIQNPGMKIIGDCEDLTMTTIEYVIHNGVPANRIGRAIVISYPFASDGNFEKTETHMVAIYYSLELDKYFYFGDTQIYGIIDTKRSLHDPLFVNWLTDEYNWISVPSYKIEKLLNTWKR